MIKSKLQLNGKSYEDYPDLLRKYIEETNPSSILEIGAGPNPSISGKLIEASNIQYDLNDFSSDELGKGQNSYKKLVGDFSKLQELKSYDLICSKMVLEHVKDPKAFHEKIFTHLNPGGISIHLFATLYSVPSLFNTLLPEILTAPILQWAQKRDPELEGKFPAYYRWCRGPIANYHKRFQNIGFQTLEHRGYLGHGYLSAKPALYPFERSFSNLLLKLNSPLFCSTSILVLRKP